MVEITRELLRTFEIKKENISIIAPTAEDKLSLVKQLEKQVFLDLVGLRNQADRCNRLCHLIDKMSAPGDLDVNQIKYVRQSAEEIMKVISIQSSDYENLFFKD